MAKILYLLLHQGGITGGQKMTVRHVEALRGLGFDAACLLGAGSTMPTWFDHNVPIQPASAPIHPDDVVVIADDASQALMTNINRPEQAVVFSQNSYQFAVSGLEALDKFPADKFPTFIACSARLGETINRAYPKAVVEVVPCFADERLFRPAAEKRRAIAFMPRKRAFEARSIMAFFRKLHPSHADFAWNALEKTTEATVARALGEAGLFLSLSRLEGVGMTTLEAMAGGCLVAGFTGVGGVEYANWENGFWVPEDDCEAAADALARAAEVFKTGGPPLRRRLEAAEATARLWSYSRFLTDLEQAWMRIAPRARLKASPLD